MSRKSIKQRKPKTALKTPTMKIAEEVLLSRGMNSVALTPGDVRRMFAPCETNGFHGCKDVREAQDTALDAAGVYDLLAHTLCSGYYQSLPQFLGYGVLSNLMQDGLIRSGVEMRADEMTRKWIEITYGGKDEQGEREQEQNAEGGPQGSPFSLPFANGGVVPVSPERKTDSIIPELNAEMERFELRKLFREAAALSGYFGGCLAYIDVGDITDDDLKMPLLLDKDTFAKGSLRGFRLVEPFNIAPGMYNASNPISAHYFKPWTWRIWGTEVHASRFLYFSEGKPSTLLLPAYNFFGIPLSQIVLDVVTHFTECREAASRLLTKFSLTVLKTDMSVVLTNGGASELDKRIRYFVQCRDNDGIMTINNDTEDIVKLETPLSGVTDIVRQSMEMVAAMFGEPVVKLWGISPGGFNSTGEADMQNHYDHINSVQEKIFRDPLKQALKVLQINKFGAIDDAITFTFAPLGADDDRAVADTQKVKADTAAVLLDRGIVSGAEVRKALAEDPKSQFTNIDPDEEVPQPDYPLDLEPVSPSAQFTEPQLSKTGGNVRLEDRDYGGSVY